MKKIFLLLVVFSFVTEESISQSGGLGGSSTSTTDSSNNPGGVGFGGALGGTTAPSTTPSNTPTTSSPGAIVPGNDSSIGRGNDFGTIQQQEERSNFLGGSGDGSLNEEEIPSSTIPNTNLPAVPPTQPSTTPLQPNTDTGVGTGSP